MRGPLVLCALIGACVPAAPQVGVSRPPPRTPPVAFQPADPATWGTLAHEVDDLAFEGGHVHFEMRWEGHRVIQTARNDFLVPVTIAWEVSSLENLTPDSSTAGVTVLSGALEVGSSGPTEVLASFQIDDPRASFSRFVDFHAQFGDPGAQPGDYTYAIPFEAGDAHDIIQGFGGDFSHTGGNYYAIDFGCAEETPVVAARDGVVVAVNDQATTHGTTPEFMSYALTNFILIAHDDGTIGQYMHLAPDGVDVRPGQRVSRGEYIGRSGNTGFSSTPHLHFQLMTSAPDGLDSVSFPFELLVAPRLSEQPVEGQEYRAWEKPR
jgi:murein DD-endopeptidase MepM/ murein hydrolase activator NlpD